MNRLYQFMRTAVTATNSTKSNSKHIYILDEPAEDDIFPYIMKKMWPWKKLREFRGWVVASLLWIYWLIFIEGQWITSMCLIYGMTKSQNFNTRRRMEPQHSADHAAWKASFFGISMPSVIGLQMNKNQIPLTRGGGSLVLNLCKNSFLNLHSFERKLVISCHVPQHTSDWVFSYFDPPPSKGACAVDSV